MKKTKNTHSRPVVTQICRLDSNVHFCRDAALLRLTGGKDKLSCIELPGQYYDICLGTHYLASARIETAGTTSDLLFRGYGAENISLDECFSVRDRINSGFRNLPDSIEAISPVIGLLPDGYYVIADFELFPVYGREHFWNGKYQEGSLLHYLYCVYGGESEFYDAPGFLFPTERAALFNAQCVKQYIDRLEEGIHFPRAIAYYLSGCMCLLLDGHHKVSAAAAQGKMARCLVIMNAEIDKNGLQAVAMKKERLFFTHNKYLGEKECHSGPLLICDKEGNKVGRICGASESAVEANDDNDEEKGLYSQETVEQWGTVPEEYCRNLKEYPDIYMFEEGTMIPPDRIKQEFSVLVKTKNCVADRKKNLRRVGQLLAYCELFPDNKWITEAQREWLKIIKAELNFRMVNVIT
ncbi:hypothetical protein NXH76_09225 [Blautia schinkii]|nr:hypothetical protein [Blautia schinkii]